MPEQDLHSRRRSSGRARRIVWRRPGGCAWRRAGAWAALLGACAWTSALPAWAAEGLYLTWNDCALGGAATSNQDFLCDTDAGQQTLYCAFVMPQPADSVLGLEMVVDIQHSAPTLPNWWRFDGSGTSGCRAGGLSSDVDFSGETACKDPWQGLAVTGIQSFSIGPPDHPFGNQARIKPVAAVLSSIPRTLDATSTYYGLKLVILNDHTVALPCAGCTGAACLVLNSILVRRSPGAIGGDIYLTGPGPANANWATWQQGTGADCIAVPVRKTTWGQLKSLYR